MLIPLLLISLSVFHVVTSFPKVLYPDVKYDDGKIYQLLTFTFPSIRCIQISSDESDSALEIINQIHRLSSNWSFINGIDAETKGCNGFVLISKHIKDVMGLLEYVPLYYENRILILIVSEGTHRHLDAFVHNASKWIGDSEVLMTIFGNPSHHFIRRQPHEFLDDLPSINGEWPEQAYGVQDFKGRTVKVGTFNCSVFSSFGFRDGEDRGIELLLVKESFDRLNLKLNIVMPTTNDLWGHYDGMSWQEGIMGLLSDGQVDMAFCGLWIVPSMVWCKLETTFPVAEGCLILIVPKPQYLNSGWFNLFYPFSKGVWGVTGISVLLASLVLFSASSFVKTFISAASSTRVTHGATFVSCVFWAVSLILATGHGGSSIKPIRQIVIWFINLGFILTTCYSSGLITQLTSPTLSPKMETIKQLVENDFIWTTPIPLDVQLMLDFNDTWEATWAKRMRVIPDLQTEWNTIATGKVALFGQKYGKEAFTLDSEYPNHLLKKFEITKFCINTYKIGLVFRPGSPYFKPLENHILRFHSSGLIDKIMNDEFERIANVKPYVKEVFETTKKTVKAGEKLNIDNLKGAFLLIIIGFICSSSAFVFEKLMKKFNSTTNKRC